MNGNSRARGPSLPRLVRGWRAVLRAARQRPGFPVIVAVLAVISSATALYPFMPVLIAAVAVAPRRWRIVYLAAVLGAATGAGLVAYAIQTLGAELTTHGFVQIGAPPAWLETQALIHDYGDYALAIAAALPVPQMPVLLALALAKTSPWAIALAVLVGKAVKYGAYIASTELVVVAVRRGLHKGQAAQEID